MRYCFLLCSYWKKMRLSFIAPFVLITSTWWWINGDCFPLKFQTPVLPPNVWSPLNSLFWMVCREDGESVMGKDNISSIKYLPQAPFSRSLFRCGPWLKSVQSYCGRPLRPQRPHHAALTGVGFSESKRFHLHLPGSASSPPSAILYKGNFQEKSSWLKTDMHEDLVFVDSWNCVFDQFVILDLGLFLALQKAVVKEVHQDPKVSMFLFMVSTPQEFLHVLDWSSSGQRSVLSLCFTDCSVKSLPVNDPLNFQRSSGLVPLVDGCSVSVWGYSLLSTLTLDCPEPKHCLSLSFALAVIQMHVFLQINRIYFVFKLLKKKKYNSWKFQYH